MSDTEVLCRIFDFTTAVPVTTMRSSFRPSVLSLAAWPSAGAAAGAGAGAVCATAFRLTKDAKAAATARLSWRCTGRARAVVGAARSGMLSPVL
jgi:hypothetical protein